MDYLAGNVQLVIAIFEINFYELMYKKGTVFSYQMTII